MSKIELKLSFFYSSNMCHDPNCMNKDYRPTVRIKQFLDTMPNGTQYYCVECFDEFERTLDELFVKIGRVKDRLDDLTNAVIEIKKKLFDEKHEEEISKETKQEG